MLPVEVFEDEDAGEVGIGLSVEFVEDREWVVRAEEKCWYGVFGHRMCVLLVCEGEC